MGGARAFGAKRPLAEPGLFGAMGLARTSPDPRDARPYFSSRARMVSEDHPLDAPCSTPGAAEAGMLAAGALEARVLEPGDGVACSGRGVTAGLGFVI